MGLGSARDVSLAEARTKAQDTRRQLVDGKDPIAAREGYRAQERLQKAGSIPFAECAKKYIDAHKAGWKNGKHAEQWQSTLDTSAGPVIGELPVRDVDTALVLRILEPIWSKKPETASRLRGRIEGILDYARVRGYRSGENPALWRGHLDKLLPWTIPAERMKAGKEHRVPLSPQAMKLIKAQPAGAYLFGGGKEGAPLSNMAMLL